MTFVDDVLTSFQTQGRAETAVFVGGSWARGWNTTRSDLDLYMLDVTRDESWSYELKLDGAVRRVDVHGISHDTSEGLLRKVSWERGEKADGFADSLRTKDWLLLERLHHAMVLVDEDRVIARLQQRLSESAHRHMLIQQHFTHSDDNAEDCIGMLEAGMLDNAVLTAQTSYLRAVDGLLAALGHYSWLSKWRPQLVREAASPLATIDDYWACVTTSRLDELGLDRWARHHLARARNISARVDVLTYEVA